MLCAGLCWTADFKLIIPVSKNVPKQNNMHVNGHTHTHIRTHTGQINRLWAALLCISGGTWSYQCFLIRYIFIKFSNWKTASLGKRNMLIGRGHSSLLTDLTVPLHLQPPQLPSTSISPSLHLTAGPQWRQTKSRGCRESGAEMGSAGERRRQEKR